MNVSNDSSSQPCGASQSGADSNLVLQWALYLAARGIPVFPLNFVKDDGSCSCGDPNCRKGVKGNRAGKHPMTTHGLNDATTDRDKVLYYWIGEPDANLGIRTGGESGIVVVDIDPRHGGDASWQQLIAQHDPLPLTPMLRTGSGGRHIYFRHPGQDIRVGNRQNMVPGIDVRGDGGYVVGPESNHVDGFYDPEPGGYLPDVPLVPMPQWLLELVLNQPPKTSATTSAVASPITQGQRHPLLLSLAGAMRSKGMSQAGIEAAIRAENQTRCTPQLEEKEIQKLVGAVMKYPAGQALSAKIISSLPREERIQETKGAFESASDPKVQSTAVNWIVRRYVAHGAITVLTGKPKQSGKSTFCAHLVRSVLDGRPFLGDLTVKTAVVWMTEERSTFEELLRRTGLIGRSDLRFLRFDPTRDATFAEQVLAAVEICKEIGAKLLVVDTVAQFMRVRGDDVKESGFWLEELKPVQQAALAGLAIILTHHERKSGGDVGDSSLGSTSFTGAGDIILSLRRPENATQGTRTRVVHALSRFPTTPDIQYIELTDEGYVQRDEASATTSAAEKLLLERAPVEAACSKPLKDLLDGTDLNESTAYKAAEKLVGANRLARTGDGKRGSPYRYWAPRDSLIPPGPMGEETIHQPGPPPPNAAEGPMGGSATGTPEGAAPTPDTPASSNPANGTP